MRKSLLAMSLLFILTACSGEPSEGNMAGAVESSIKQEIDAAKQMAVALMGQQAADAMTKDAEFKGFDTFEKISCKEVEGTPAYDCDFKFSAKVGGKVTEQLASGRFSNGDKGWGVVLKK